MNNALELHKISVSEMDNNCYLLCAGDEALLIDASADAPALLALAADHGVKISAVLTTHRHWDHVRALKEVLNETGAVHYSSFLDAPALPAPVDVELEHGDTLPFAGYDLPVIVLRGHTPGGAAIAAEIDGVTNRFAGDPRSPGGGGITTSYGYLVRPNKHAPLGLFHAYPDDAIVRPGHGAPTTLGAERPHMDEWWERRW